MCSGGEIGNAKSGTLISAFLTCGTSVLVPRWKTRFVCWELFHNVSWERSTLKKKRGNYLLWAVIGERTLTELVKRFFLRRSPSTSKNEAERKQFQFVWSRSRCDSGWVGLQWNARSKSTQTRNLRSRFCVPDFSSWSSTGSLLNDRSRKKRWLTV